MRFLLNVALTAAVVVGLVVLGYQRIAIGYLFVQLTLVRGVFAITILGAAHLMKEKGLLNWGEARQGQLALCFAVV